MVAVDVFHETEYGAVVSSVLSGLPSRRNCTPATPTLSDAVAVTLIVPETVASLVGDVSETVGKVVSGGGASVVALRMADLGETFPAASVALTV